MNFFLVSLAGPLQDSEIEIGKQPLRIGQAAINDVQIDHPMVTTEHCQLWLEGTSPMLRRTHPSATTLVNSLPVTQVTLHDGDTVRIGPAVFRVEARTSPVRSALTVRLEDEGGNFSPQILLTREESLYLSDEGVTDNAIPAARTVRESRALLKIITALNAIQGLAGLEGPVLELLSEILPADRGAIILSDRISSDNASISGWRRTSATSQLSLPKSVVNKVVHTGTAILGTLEQSALSDRGGLILRRSAMVAPMMVFDRTIGAIYLEAQEGSFDRSHLEFLFAVACNAAMALEHTRERAHLTMENRKLRAELEGSHNIIGQHPRMQKVYEQIRKSGPSNATVLICGESGTGKELVARSLHSNSPRSQKQFLALNCAAITETLMESELFGHEKGAFTGAIAQQRGLIEVADGGTLFLDEVSEMTPAMQSKLLRVLQEHEFERVGGRRPVKVDVRIIGATNRDLEHAVKEGTFRQDLFYRLNVIMIKLPALRERCSDIPLLATHFAFKYGQKSARSLRGVSEAAQKCLLAYSWPGNVRELENAIEHAVVLGESELINPDDLPETIVEAGPQTDGSAASYHDHVRQTKRNLILRAVADANGSYVKAAQRLGVHPNYLHRLIRAMDLKTELKKQTVDHEGWRDRASLGRGHSDKS